MLCPWGEFRVISQVGPREEKTLVWGYMPRERLSWGLNPGPWAPRPVFSSVPLCLLDSQAAPALSTFTSTPLTSPNLPSVTGQAQLSNPTSFTSWLAEQGEEGREGLAGRGSGSVLPWG